VVKPIVDGLEKKLADKAQVIRLDVMSDVGRQAAARYGVRGVPTVVVVDGFGQPVDHQVGIVRPGRVIDQINTILATR
jgi:thioredoxin-like negative regulator of GroEL